MRLQTPECSRVEDILQRAGRQFAGTVCSGNSKVEVERFVKIVERSQASATGLSAGFLQLAREAAPHGSARRAISGIQRRRIHEGDDGSVVFFFFFFFFFFFKKKKKKISALTLSVCAGVFGVAAPGFLPRDRQDPRVVVPFPAGGAVDTTVARIIAPCGRSGGSVDRSSTTAAAP